MELLQSIVSNIWAVFLVVFFFGGSVFVHELGHFLAARWRGMKVERFSIGMGRPIFQWKGRDGTEYWIAWAPIGGYVKLPQLADLGPLEGDTKIDVSKLPPSSFSDKIIVSVAGALFNLIFAFLLACVLWIAGMPEREDTSTSRIGYVAPRLILPDGTRQMSPAAKADLRPGDVIREVDGRRVRDFNEVTQSLIMSSGRTSDGSERLVHLTVERGTETLVIDVNPVLAGDEKTRRIGIGPAYQVVVGQVAKDSPASRIGLQPGDHILRMDDREVLSAQQLAEYLESHAAARVSLQVSRGGSTTELSVPPQQNVQEFLSGFDYMIKARLVHENPWRQFESILSLTVQSLVSIINPRSDIGISKMTGPVGIVTTFWQAATSEYPVRVAMWLTILINVSLAVFNLLPIPVLDGGHILFATIGKIRGKALPPDFVAAAQSVFVVLLFSMLIYVTISDFRRIVRNARADAPATATTPTPPQAIPAPAK